MAGNPQPVMGSADDRFEWQGRIKVWVEAGGEPVLGGGLERLLRHVDRLGSLSAAAAEMRMSYRQAWGMVKKVEQRLGLALVERHAGGVGGGGAALTDAGKALLASFQAWQAEVEEAAVVAFQRHFGGTGVPESLESRPHGAPTRNQ